MCAYVGLSYKKEQECSIIALLRNHLSSSAAFSQLYRRCPMAWATHPAAFFCFFAGGNDLISPL